MPPNESKYDVLLSHNSADKPVVEQLAVRLRDAGLAVWFDKWALVPGEPWQAHIERALGDSRSVAVFLGPGGLGPWHELEMRAALNQQIEAQRGFRVIPVLLPGATAATTATMPAFLKQLTWVNFPMLDDAEAWHRLLAGIRGQAPGYVPPASVSPQAEDSQAPIVPRGLRAFDERDRAFFLRLLPGARDRHGLPVSVGFWKDALEQIDPERTFPVGLIYGPSGCGKSSLVRAGLIPHLAEFVLPIHLDATPDATEAQLLQRLRKRLPRLPLDLDLPGTMEHLRQDAGPLEGRKLVLILDQFEQWLHAHPVVTGQPLLTALAHCDGGRLQAVVMLRDEFFLAIDRFMEALNVPIRKGINMALVDLFPAEHARRVLAEYGRAYDRVPAGEDQFTREHRRFIEGAVAQLAANDRVVPVHIALFADMVQNKPWTPQSLRELGGAAGVGVAFLEENFDRPTANPRHRAHRPAAMAVLKALLPEAGTDIKGRRRSYADLMHSAGYQGQAAEFDRLLEILNGDLRIITPVEATGGNDKAETETGESTVGLTPPRSPGDNPAQRSYQLTHDYLVGPLREWLTRRQRLTVRGRALLRLEERAAQWSPTRHTRFLPNPAEYVNIVCFAPRTNLSDDQRALLRVAHRFYAVWGSVALALLVTLLVGLNWQWETTQWQRTDALVRSLLEAPPEAVPYAIENLAPVQARAEPVLREVVDSGTFDGQPATHRQQLHALLALADFGDRRQKLLIDAVAAGPAGHSANLVAALAPIHQTASEEIWTRYQAASAPEQRPQRVRYATIALQLGDLRPAHRLLDLPEGIERDPGSTPEEDRTAFIHGLHQWPGDRLVLARWLHKHGGAVDVRDIRSAICAGLGYVAWDSLVDQERAVFKSALETLYLTAPDGGTRGAAAYTLARWDQRLPADTTPTQPDPPWFVNSLGMTMIRVPDGKFLMGDLDSPWDDERPRHEVTLTKAVYVCDREVTVEWFTRFLDDKEYPAEKKPVNWSRSYPNVSPTPDSPSAEISWEDAVLLCNWLSHRDQREECYRRIAGTDEQGGRWEWNVQADGYRLPTEAEWEYACRATSQTDYCFGDDPGLLGEYGYYGGTFGSGNSGDRTWPAGRKLCNGWGLFDMHGSLWEW